MHVDIHKAVADGDNIFAALVPKHCTNEQQRAVLGALQILAPGVKLGAMKWRALSTCIAALPSILQTAATPASVKQGFFRSGMIDRASGTRPSLRAILATRRGGFTEVRLFFFILFHMCKTTMLLVLLPPL